MSLKTRFAALDASLAALSKKIDDIITSSGAAADTVDGFHASDTATAGKLLALDANKKLPASITGNAETVGGLSASISAMAGKLLALDANAKLPASITGDAGNITSQYGYNATNGYVRLSTGLIIQWGATSVSPYGVDYVALPMTYPSRHFTAACGGEFSDTTKYSCADCCPYGAAVKIVNFSGAEQIIYWISIGC
jgi:hypothetical protein